MPTRCSAVIQFLLALGGIAAGTIEAGSATPQAIEITAPLDGAVFPRDFAPPIFRWRDPSGSSRWSVTVELSRGEAAVSHECDRTEWRPSATDWERIKVCALRESARLSVRALGSGARPTSAVTFRVSKDPVAAPILYREVPLPVGFAMDHKAQIRWMVGDVSESEPPRTVLAGMATCANCHSVSADGRTLAMDIDFAADKGTYAIAPIGSTVRIAESDLITWNDYRREDGEATFGLLSALSPDGRSVVSTVKETIYLQFLSDLDCSQLFFPTRGILASYDREKRAFRSVRGADSPDLVQTNPSFSPDGRTLVFSRAKLPDIPRHGGVILPDVLAAVTPDLLSGRRKVLFDLYRVPYAEGGGGIAEPIPGASGNGRSNYFARYSPDGRWIVFCQASSMMLNRPDSALYIVPANGGSARRLQCNAAGRMNSWHSFSPNGKWLVYASKTQGPYTQLWLTHIDESGHDSVPVHLDGFVDPERAANIPEFVSITRDQLREIRVASEIRHSPLSIPQRPR